MFSLFPPTIDSIIQDIVSKIDLLSEIQHTHDSQAVAHAEEIERLESMRLMAQSEALRASTLADNFRRLIAVPTTD